MQLNLSIDSTHLKGLQGLISLLDNVLNKFCILLILKYLFPHSLGRQYEAGQPSEQEYCVEVMNSLIPIP